MWTIFTKFLTSKFSGWVSILAVVATLILGGFSTKLIYDYKELQRRAAFCDGKLSNLTVIKELQDRVIEDSQDQVKEVVSELEELKKQPGCGSESAPDSALDPHRVRDD